MPENFCGSNFEDSAKSTKTSKFSPLKIYPLYGSIKSIWPTEKLLYHYTIYYSALKISFKQYRWWKQLMKVELKKNHVVLCKINFVGTEEEPCSIV